MAVLSAVTGPACTSRSTPPKQPPQKTVTATPTRKSVALLNIVEDNGKLKLQSVRQLANEQFRGTSILGAPTHQWSLHAASGQMLISGTFQIRRTLEVPPGGPTGTPQNALNAPLKVVPFALHVPWPQHGQHIEIEALDASGHPVPHSKMVWP